MITLAKPSEFYLSNIELRPIDQFEATCMTQGRIDYLNILRESVGNSHYSWIYLVDNKPEGVGGVVPHGNDSGYIWTVGSHRLTKYPKEFHKVCLSQVRMLLGSYKVLSNYIYYRNKTHKLWVRALGGRFRERVMINDIPFDYFEIR
jgi:hypothetical protein